MFSCYTRFVLKNVTVTVEEEALRWARIRAAEQNISLSRYVGELLSEEMANTAKEREAISRSTEAYRTAYEEWKRIPRMVLDAANRLTREEANERQG